MSAGKPLPDSQQPWLSRRRFWTLIASGICLMLLVVAAGTYYGYVTDVPLVISRETTYITEPLTADGKRVDYFAAAELMCYPPELATDDNGFRMVVQALGVSPEYTEEQQQEIYKKLGLDPSILPTMKFASPHDLLWDHAEDLNQSGELPMEMGLDEYVEHLEGRLGEPWTIDNLPMMAGWLEQNGAALDLMSEAVHKPEFCAPWIKSGEQPPLVTMSLVAMQDMRHYARGFNARCHYRLAAGDLDGAIDDIVACARLGRHFQTAGTVIENLVGIACESIADAMGAAGSLEHQPTTEQLRRLVKELDSLRERRSVEHSLENERLCVLDAIQALAWGDETSEPDLLQGRGYGIDWNTVLHRVNQNFEAVARDGSNAMPTWIDPKFLGQFILREHRSELAADLYFCDVHPSFGPYHEARRRILCKENLLRIAIAMLLYEKQHGTLPPAYSIDEQGNPLHSWRVLILPYLGYDELYSQIRLDEPWNSTHNSQFHAADVPIYQCPTGVHSPGQTIYTVIEGDTTAFNGGEGKRLDSFGPNSANLILVAERIDPVGWMDPMREVPFAIAERGINIDGVTTGLGSEHVGGLHTALRSGAVKFFSENISDEDLRGLLEGTIEHAP